MKKYLLFVFVLLLLLVGCTKDDNSKTPSTPDGRTIESINCVDSNGKDIVTHTIYRSYEGSGLYTHSGVFVIATYTDKTTSDVTAYANFSTVDTRVIGVYPITVSYAGKEDNYQLNVIPLPVTRLELNTTNVRLVYQIGETFNRLGLVVTAHYADGTAREISDYSMVITDINNTIQSATAPFTRTGSYDVTISYEGSKTYFSFVVYSSYHSIKNDFIVDSLSNQLSLDNDGKYTFQTTTNIYNSSLVTLNAIGSDIIYRSKNSDGTNINESYAGTTYHGMLQVGNEYGLSLTLKSEAEIIMVVGGLSGRSLLFVGDTTTIPVGNITSKTNVLHCRLKAGTYTILTNHDSLNLYEMIFYFDDVDENYDSLELDTATVKKTYNINDGLDLSNLKVWAVSSNLRLAIDITICEIKLVKGNTVKALLDEAGTYDVLVTLSMGSYSLSASYQIVVNADTLEEELLIPEAIIQSSNKVIISFENNTDVATSFIEFHVTVTNENGYLANIDNFSNVLDDLNPNETYKISGYYFATTDRNTIIELKDVYFTTAPYTTLEQIDETELPIHIGSNMAELSVKEFEQNIPTGYIIKKFEVVSENDGSVLSVIPYEQGMETIYITNLTSNSDYVLYVCYESVANNTRNALRADGQFEVNGYHYQFKFKGYNFHTNGYAKEYRIRMQYHGDTLYTFYINQNNYSYNDFYCSFALPTELEEYYIAGCQTDLYNIAEDIDVEIILLKKIVPNGVNVVYYGFHRKLVSYQTVASVSEAIAPNIPLTETYKNVNYNFVSWSDASSDPANNVWRYAIYETDTSSTVPTVNFSEFYVSNDSLLIKTYLNYKENVISHEERIIDPECIEEDIVFDSTGGNCILLESSHYYLYRYIINYDLNDGNGVKQKVYEKKFRTLASNASYSATVSLTPIGLDRLKINTSGQAFDILLMSPDYYSAKVTYKKYIHFGYDYIILGDFKQGETLNFYIGKLEEDDTNQGINIHYVYKTTTTYQVPNYKELYQESIPVIESLEYDRETNRVIVHGQNLAHVSLWITINYIYFELTPNYTPYLTYGGEEDGATLYEFYPEYEGYFDSFGTLHFTYDGLLYTYSPWDLSIPPYVSEYQY